MADLALAPFVPTLQAAARQQLGAALQAALAVDAPVAVERRPDGLAATVAGTPAVELRLRRGGGRWTIGDWGVTVQPDDALLAASTGRSLLQRWGARLGDGVDGRALDTAVAQWDSVARLDDTFYARLEHSTNGVSGMLLTGFGCNQDCGFCWQNRAWPDPPEATVFAWLETMAEAGLQRLTISGGEPTIARYLPRLVRRANEHGMAVHLNTNATRCRSERYTAELVDAGLDSVLVSLHAADAELSDRLTRAPKTHRATVAGIHRLLDAGVLVVLNCVVERENVDQLPAHAAFVKEQFVDAHPDNPVVAVNYSQPGPYWDREQYRQRIAPLDVAGPKVVEAARLLDDAGVLLLLAGTCGFPACAIQGAEHLLQWRDRGDLDTRELDERTVAFDACRRCAAREQCVGVRDGYAQRWADRGLSPYAEPLRGVWAERVAALPERKRRLLGL